MGRQDRCEGAHPFHQQPLLTAVVGVTSPLNTQGSQASFCGDSAATAEGHVFADVSEISVSESKSKRAGGWRSLTIHGGGVGVGSPVPRTWAHGGVRCFRIHGRHSKASDSSSRGLDLRESGEGGVQGLWGVGMVGEQFL